jgi:O-antigen/teichoic acid export membrane protein
MSSLSVSVRIVVSLAASAIRLALSFITGLMIARVLGPVAYGDYSFLLGSFTAIASLLDMGTSTAFFTFVAQRQRGLRYVAYYAAWIGVQLLLMVAVVVCLPDRLLASVWLGQSRDAVLLALFMTFAMNQLWAFTSQLGESVRDTVGVQIRNLVASVLYLGAVVGLAAAGWVSIRALLFLGGTLYLLMAALYAMRLYRRFARCWLISGPTVIRR